MWGDTDLRFCTYTCIELPHVPLYCHFATYYSFPGKKSVLELNDQPTYYELTKVSVVANVHSVNLVLTVLLKTTDSRFTSFRLIALPTQISPVVKYSVDYAFFALQHSRRSYLLFTEADYGLCDKGSITVCPAETAVYNSQSLKCESSLFFSNRERQQFMLTEAHLSPPDTVSAVLW